MYKGFPVGCLLFWSNGMVGVNRAIDIDTKQKNVPRLLIVDGQQRLTSLYAVLKNAPVKRDDYTDQKISIAFRPNDGNFEVTVLYCKDNRLAYYILFFSLSSKLMLLLLRLG
jgi:uncharacterized protein with ParB-like and HNH nuclease domain